MDPEVVARIEELAERSGTYRPEAFFWVLRTLEFTRRRMQRDGHVSGRELCEGMRQLGVEEYGPMAFEVFTHWGLQKTEDIGRIVFALVDDGLLRKTDEDTLEDFVGVYDFREVFVRELPW
jgi:uncharacterized repeat protein (TIGR04138 family)